MSNHLTVRIEDYLKPIFIHNHTLDIPLNRFIRLLYSCSILNCFFPPPNFLLLIDPRNAASSFSYSYYLKSLTHPPCFGHNVLLYFPTLRWRYLSPMRGLANRKFLSFDLNYSKNTSQKQRLRLGLKRGIVYSVTHFRNPIPCLRLLPFVEFLQLHKCVPCSPLRLVLLSTQS